MTKKLTKVQIKVIARMHSAIFLSGIDDNAFDDCGITEEDSNKIVDEVKALADKICGGFPMNIADSESIIKFAKENY